MEDVSSASGAPGDRLCPLGRAGPAQHGEGLLACAVLQGQGRDPRFGLLSPGESGSQKPL